MNEDPLTQLRDIHTPDSIGLWPPAPGWWILAALLLIAIVVTVIWRYRHAVQNRYRGEAVAALENAWRQYQQGQQAQAYLFALTHLLKRTAITAYPKLNIEGLHGQAWLRFLDASLGNNNTQFTRGTGQQLLDLPYRPVTSAIELKPLHQLALQWLAKHQSQAAVIKNQRQTTARNPRPAAGANHAAA